MFFPPVCHSILIVSDDEMTRLLLVKCLELGSHNVIGVADSTEALQSLSSNSIDLIIVDIAHFQADEAALYRKIREVSDIPMIISTSPHRTFTRSIPTTLNDPTFLTKPYRFADLMSCISLVLRVRDLARFARPAF